jgi:hypothetical protein
MKPLRILLAAALLASPFAAQADEEDVTFGHLLTLIQSVTRIAAGNEDPQRGFADLLAGRNADANRAASSLLDGMTGDLPAAQRAQVSGIAADVLAIARKGMNPAPAAQASPYPFSPQLP